LPIARTFAVRCLFALALAALAGLPSAHGTPARAASNLALPPGFTLETIARVGGARELAVAANGDLFVGTTGNAVYIVADAEATPARAQPFVRVNDRPLAGVAIAAGTMFIGGQFGVYAIPFIAGDRVPRGAARKIATLRPSGVGRGHKTTTIAVGGDTLYAGVGSSCNNCQPELDATRATIQQMRLDGSDMTTKAEHIRNAIALTLNPQSGALWAGVAGQDELAHGHPYEIVDDISAHPGVADFGWPHCYEDRKAATAGNDCSNAALPRAVVPAYETPVGAAFYPVTVTGRYAFGPNYRGGLFVALHGSWHLPPVPPRVVFFPMTGDTPRTPVDWANPAAQWDEFLDGFQRSDGAREGRPTGIAVGTDGSLFVADDASGAVYRIRPKHS
jgi:glucose/arabinose dehydrogenase